MILAFKSSLVWAVSRTKDLYLKGSKMRNVKMIVLGLILVAILAVSPAESAIVYSGKLNLEGPNLSIDIDNDGNPDIVTEWRLWAVGNGYSASGFDAHGDSMLFLNTRLAGHESFPGTKAPLDYGDIIGAMTPGELLWAYNSNDSMMWTVVDMWADPSVTYSGLWHDIDNKYLGFQMAVGYDYYYGWVQLDTDAFNHVVLVDYAYEDVPGIPIVAGALPIHGGFDGDCDVDGSDLAIFIGTYADTEPSEDLSIVGGVNDVDIAVFAEYFGRADNAVFVDAIVSVVDGLYADDPPDPMLSTLTSVPELVDRIRFIGTGIEIGTSVNEDQNIGLDLGSPKDLGKVFVYTRPPESTFDESLFSWAVYYGDNIAGLWTRITNSAGFVFDTMENRFEISFPRTKARYFKVVNTSNDGSNLEVTEIEAYNETVCCVPPL
jgi:hypothetical protein